jgi:signal transduction histidine kinase/CheY-like chemotaxis protein/PAS domain-containing protein
MTTPFALDHLNHLDELLAHVSHPWFVRNAEGVHEQVSASLCELMGVSSDDLLGRPLEALLKAHLAGVASEGDRQVFESGIPATANEPALWDPSGPVRPLRRIPLTDPTGHIVGILGIYEMDEALERLPRLLGVVEDSAGAGGWEWDTGTGRVFWTPGMYRLRGFESDALTPTPGDLWRGFTAESQTRVEGALAALMSGGGPQSIEVEEAIPGGGLRRLRVRCHPLVRDGRVARIYGTMVELEGQDLPVELLQRSARAFATPGSDGLFRAVARNLAEALDASELIIGLGESGDDGEPLLRSVARFANGRIREPIVYRIRGTPCERVMQDGPSRFEGNLEALFPDDPLLAGIEARAYAGVPLRGSSGQTIGVVAAFLRDGSGSSEVEEALLALHASRIGAELDRMQALRESERHEMELLHAQRMEATGRLASGIAHDFNNLLTVIGGNADLLANLAKESLPSRELIGEIQSASEEAAALSRQLMELSLRRSPKLEPVELGALLDEMEGLLERLVEGRVELRIEQGDGERWVRADPSHLEQMILALAMNALESMRDGGDLRIAARADEIRKDAGHGIPASVPPGRYAVLEVEDTGVGIPDELRKRIFEPFFTTKDDGSSGLGLSTVHSMVESLGGHIALRSIPGEGSLFRIYLPLLEGRALARTVVPNPDGRAVEILLVEDDPALRRFVRDTLEGEGFRVLEAQDGFAAEEIIKGSSTRPQLLLTDVVMPGRSGKATAMAIRQQRPEIGVLFMSGFSGDVLARDEVERLHADLLLKPFTPAVLLDRVHSMIDRSGG